MNNIFSNKNNALNKMSFPKKHIILGVLFLLLINGVFATTFFYEDFESGNLDDWTVTSDRVNINSNNPISGVYDINMFSFGLGGRAGASTAIYAFSDADENYLDFRFEIKGNISKRNLFYAKLVNNSLNGLAIGFNFVNDDSNYARVTISQNYNDGDNSNGTYSSDTNLYDLSKITQVILSINKPTGLGVLKLTQEGIVVLEKEDINLFNGIFTYNDFVDLNKVQLRNEANNFSAIYTNYIYIDNIYVGGTPPTTTFSSSQIAGTTDQNITLTCTDNNSGCYQINYNINNEGWEQVNVSTIDWTNNLRNYWKFDETSGTTLFDEKGLNNLNNTNVIINQTGKINKAILNTGQIDTGIEYLDSNITMSGWGKFNGTPSNMYVLYIPITVDKQNHIMLYLINSTTIQIQTIAQNVAVRYNSGNITVPDLNSNWIFFSVSYDKTNNLVSWRVNSQTGGGSGGTLNGSKNVTNLNIGSTNFYVDEVSLWTRVLNNTDSNDLYNNGNGLAYNSGSELNSYSFLYSGTGDHNIQYFSTDKADNNETIKLSYFPMFKSENELSNSRIKLTGVTWYNGYEITSWQYQVNGTPLSGTSDRIKYYSTQSNEDLNVCLTTNSTDTFCKSVLTWDTINPIIDANIQTSGYGFTNTFDINYNLTCNDNFPFITYKVIWINNGTTTILDEQYLTTGTLLQGTLDLNAGQEATLTFTCTDASNNQATYTAPTQYAIQFNIVDEITGLPFDLTKVTHAQAYTYDGNYLFNFKDTNNATQTYWSPTSVIRFDFTYPDEAQTKISREIDFDYITDANVPVCAAEYQQFYLYRFLSTTEKPIILHNDFANCYSLASTTKFLWTTYLTNTAYTINKPYYLYTYSNGVKSLLAILDGANNTEINLDILQFNQAQYQFDVSSDSIVFRPGENDSNTIVFYFFSPNNNTWVNLEIYDQSNNLLWDYLENTDTNSFQVTFFYGDLDINSDDLLKIVVTVLNDGEETSFFKYFNTKGEAYAGLLNPIVAIVLSFFVLFFGITMVSYRFAMGWFGIVISFLAIGILALAPLYDYILFLMAIYFIIGLFIGLIGREQTLGVN